MTQINNDQQDLTTLEKTKKLASRLVAVCQDDYQDVRHSFNNSNGSVVTCDKVGKFNQGVSVALHFQQSKLYFMIGTYSSPEKLESIKDDAAKLVSDITGLAVSPTVVVKGTSGRKNTNKNYLQLDVFGYDYDNITSKEAIRDDVHNIFEPAYEALLEFARTKLPKTNWVESCSTNEDDTNSIEF